MAKVRCGKKKGFLYYCPLYLLYVDIITLCSSNYTTALSISRILKYLFKTYIKYYICFTYAHTDIKSCY